MSDSTAASLRATTQRTFVERHPIRGILWGLMMGIGLTVVLIVTKVINLDLTMMIVVTLVAILVGLLWSTLGPAKAPKGPPPATVTVSTAPEVSRFDDFPDTAPRHDEPLRAPPLASEPADTGDDEPPTV